MEAHVVLDRAAAGDDGCLQHFEDVVHMGNTCPRNLCNKRRDLRKHLAFEKSLRGTDQALHSEGLDSAQLGVWFLAQDNPVACSCEDSPLAAKDQRLGRDTYERQGRINVSGIAARTVLRTRLNHKAASHHDTTAWQPSGSW